MKPVIIPLEKKTNATDCCDFRTISLLGRSVCLLGLMGKHKLFEICLYIYGKGNWPRDFTESIIIPIEKKQGGKERVDFRTTSLIPYASKILMKILTLHLQAKADDFLGPE